MAYSLCITRLLPRMVFALMTVFGAAVASADEPGLAVGEDAPGFVLMDQFGKEQSLETMLKDRNVAIVFYRSASW